MMDSDPLYQEEIQKRIKALLAKLKEMEGTIQALENKQSALQANYLNEDETIMTPQNVGKALPNLEEEAQKKILRSLISEIQLEGKHIKPIRFSFDKIFRVESISIHHTLLNPKNKFDFLYHEKIEFILCL
jgi:predicted nuclease with TOPRIM domain